MFGQNGGPVFGFELSVTSLKDYGKTVYGGVVSYDFCKHYNRFHAGIEVARGFGVDIGPTWIIEDGELYSGFSFTPYFGLLLIPYVSYTWIYQKYTNFEGGAFIKAPVKLKGEKFSIGH